LSKLFRGEAKLFKGEDFLYFGHIVDLLIINSEHYPYVVLHRHVNGTGQKGRPRKRWLDNIHEDCEVLGLSLPVAAKFVTKLVWRSVVQNLGCQCVAIVSSSSDIREEDEEEASLVYRTLSETKITKKTKRNLKNGQKVHKKQSSRYQQPNLW